MSEIKDFEQAPIGKFQLYTPKIGVLLDIDNTVNIPIDTFSQSIGNSYKISSESFTLPVKREKYEVRLSANDNRDNRYTLNIAIFANWD